MTEIRIKQACLRSRKQKKGKENNSQKVMRNAQAFVFYLSRCPFIHTRDIVPMQATVPTEDKK